jgi:hypothetical protein
LRSSGLGFTSPIQVPCLFDVSETRLPPGVPVSAARIGVASTVLIFAAVLIALFALRARTTKRMTLKNLELLETSELDKAAMEDVLKSAQKTTESSRVVDSENASVKDKEDYETGTLPSFFTDRDRGGDSTATPSVRRIVQVKKPLFIRHHRFPTRLHPFQRRVTVKVKNVLSRIKSRGY